MFPPKKVLPIVGLFGAASSLSVIGVSMASESAKTLQTKEDEKTMEVKPKFEVSPATAKELLSQVSSKEGGGGLSFGQFPELEKELLSKIGEDLSSQEALEIVTEAGSRTGEAK
ncbi:hypothetical protein MHF_1272 [Mycoplasma haemofelis Ohio2]|uniref:Uncharacterized protein n=1 Tax=Mycoplasma haemofelis (strain Ohio2) TaxID=859194 RepID=F6FFU0_MYCHI|nr:hypothetical protein MHF_1272 [Mycoplasma haemofelis Ohio2]